MKYVYNIYNKSGSEKFQGGEETSNHSKQD